MTGNPVFDSEQELRDLRKSMAEISFRIGELINTKLSTLKIDLEDLMGEFAGEVVRAAADRITEIRSQTEEKPQEAPETIDVDTLPLEQRLILETLQSRAREGHRTWSITEEATDHLKALTALGLVTWDSGPVENWVRATLTIQGSALLSAGGIPEENSDSESEDGFTSAERSLLWNLWIDYIRGAGSSLLSPESSEAWAAAMALSEQGLVVLWPTDEGKDLNKIKLTKAGHDLMRDLKETAP